MSTRACVSHHAVAHCGVADSRSHCLLAVLACVTTYRHCAAHVTGAASAPGRGRQEVAVTTANMLFAAVAMQAQCVHSYAEPRLFHCVDMYASLCLLQLQGAYAEPRAHPHPPGGAPQA